MKKNIELGKNGEAVARDYLIQKGHLILHCNYRYEHNEVDIISLDRDILVFSEIKTRSGFGFGFPEEAVNQKKQASLKKVAEFYLMEHPEFEKLRFDVISCILQEGKILDLWHFEDAFY